MELQGHSLIPGVLSRPSFKSWTFFCTMSAITENWMKIRRGMYCGVRRIAEMEGRKQAEELTTQDHDH